MHGAQRWLRIAAIAGACLANGAGNVGADARLDADLVGAVAALDPGKTTGLLKSGASPDAKDGGGTPALIVAAKKGDDPLASQVAAILLAFGADPAARDARQRTALEYAVDIPAEDFADPSLQKSHGTLVYALVAYSRDQRPVEAARKIIRARGYDLFEAMIQRGQKKAAERGLAPAPPAASAPPTATAKAQPTPPPREPKAAPLRSRPASDSRPEWCGPSPCPCQDGTSLKHSGSENLQSCKLAENATIQGVRCAKGGTAAFYPTGELWRCSMTEPLRSSGVPCSATGIELYRSGQLQQCWPQGQTAVGGVLCTYVVTLEKDGTLRRCQLAAEHRFKGGTIPAGDWVTWNSGIVYRWEMATGPAQIGKLTCQGYFNYFHPDGSVAKCSLAEPATVDGVPLEKGKDACFNPDGRRVDCKTMSFLAL